MNDQTPSPSAARRIVVLNRDAFFGVKIGNTLRALGYQVEFATTTERFLALVKANDGAAALGVIDINAAPDWDAVTALVATTTTPLLAFGSHLDVDGLRAAKGAGATRVVSNGDFHRDMVALVERYATR